MSHNWSSNDIDLLVSEYPLTPSSELAERLGRTQKAIMARAQKLGIKKHHSNRDLVPTEEQIQVILGTSLGDGHISLREGHGLPYLSIVHSDAQKEWIEWKYNKLKSLTTKPPRRLTVDDPWRRLFMETRRFPWLQEAHSLLYDSNKKKVVRREMLDTLNEVALACWYLDDGCLTGSFCFLSTYSFTYEEHEIMIEYFRERWNLNFTIGKHSGGYYRIVIPAGCRKDFFDLIYPIVSDVKRMRYKFVGDT